MSVLVMVAKVMALAVLGAIVYRYLARARTEVRTFLGVTWTQAVRLHEGTPLSMCFRADVYRALKVLLEAKGLTDTVRGLKGVSFFFDSQTETALSQLIHGTPLGAWGSIASVSLPDGVDRTANYPSHCLHLISGGPFPIAIQMTLLPEFKCSLVCAVKETPEAVAWASLLIKELEEWALAHSIYRGQPIAPRFEPWGSPRIVEFLDLKAVPEAQIPPAVRGQVDDHFLSFLKRASLLDGAGIRSHRGLLLCGEPGTGKTTTCRYLKSQLQDHTFIVVQPDALMQLASIFSLARDLSPAVVVLEDVDLMVRNRETMDSSTPTLQTLLNELDGLQARSRVSVVLTSNSWEFIEKALGDRPGRIDHKIHFALPSETHRLTLIQSFLGGVACDVAAQELARATAGLTPALMREAIELGTVLTTVRTAAATARLDQAGFDEAMRRARSVPESQRSRRVVGLAPSGRQVRDSA